jgi:hypothetical protein
MKLGAPIKQRISYPAKCRIFKTDVPIWSLLLPVYGHESTGVEK